MNFFSVIREVKRSILEFLIKSLELFWDIGTIKYTKIICKIVNIIETFIIKFIKLILNSKYQLDDDFIKKLKLQIRKNASPRHVPRKIIQINDIPRTKSGKIVELAVKNMISGIKVNNIEALSNPESLKFFENILELKY